MTKVNLVKEECTNCHKIYSTTMAELSRTWISNCESCKTAISANFTKAVSESYALLLKPGA